MALRTSAAINLATSFPDLPTAACSETSDPDAFYSDKAHRVEQARDICRRCPEIRDCLAWALTHREWGVWAGTTEEQRTSLRRNHRQVVPA